ncbi:MAG: hypothetical protein L3J70_05090 [Gammaproteobacteria bacterium]|nr:hypothetical protein [Gammaproteobacteria bacterium]
MSRYSNTLRVVILTDSGNKIVAPLLHQGLHIVGVSEIHDEFGALSKSRQWLERLYWLIYKRQNMPYLSEYARNNNITYFEKKEGSKAGYIQWLKSLNPDVLVLYLAPILPRDIFSIPRLGTLNIHPSLLPKYRGSNPYFWMYVNMDMTAGVTLHYIDDNIDTGDIVAQRQYEIELGTPVLEVGKKLILDYAIPALVDSLKQLEETGKLNIISQPPESLTPCTKPLSNAEYIEVLDFEHWSLERLWHVLHSTEQWRGVFLPEVKNSKHYSWSIGHFEERPQNGTVGCFGQDERGYYIKHRHGVIYFNRQFSWKKYFLSLIRNT